MGRSAGNCQRNGIVRELHIVWRVVTLLLKVSRDSKRIDPSGSSEHLQITPKFSGFILSSASSNFAEFRERKAAGDCMENFNKS